MVSNQNWSLKLQSLKKESNSLWNVSKILKNRNKNIPPIKTPDGVLQTNQEKGAKFGTFFALQHVNDMPSDQLTENSVANGVFNLNSLSSTNIKLIRSNIYYYHLA